MRPLTPRAPLEPAHPAAPGHRASWLVLALSLATQLEASASAPPGRFVVSSDTVTDQYTNRVWQRTVSTSATSYMLAANQCAALAIAGTGGWRLPRIKELQSLRDVHARTPAIDPSVFPNTPANNFWSSTPHMRDRYFSVLGAEFSGWLDALPGNERAVERALREVKEFVGLTPLAPRSSGAVGHRDAAVLAPRPIRRAAGARRIGSAARSLRAPRSHASSARFRREPPTARVQR
jgi:hypothetical protein